MKIALASSHVITRDIQHNLSSILQTVKKLSGRADIILFGESSLQGFDCLTWNYEIDRHIAVSQNDSVIMQIRDAAKQSRIAISFGYIERAKDSLFSSQIVIDYNGTVIHNFHRVSIGWKEYWHTDNHYCEGDSFEIFSYGGKTFAIGLCGDLWTEGRPEEMKALNADIVLWPVWCDFPAERWNESIKYEYARQAALCGDHVLYVNPFCADPNVTDAAGGGSVYFKKGLIAEEKPAGKSDILIVEL